MLRINESNVLVVPPFECAWLTGRNFQLLDCCGCITFEAKGDNDVTVIFKQRPGAKRWQPLQQQEHGYTVEDNYTVILGSHRNSCLKFEKNGVTIEMVEKVAGSKVSSRDFCQYWIYYRNGQIAVGAGAPGTGPYHQWQDPTPIPGIQYAGLSCWDKHVSYRHIEMLSSVRFREADAVAPPLEPPWPPSLFSLATASARAVLDPSNVCDVVGVAEFLLPTTSELYAHCLDIMARRFEAVVEANPGSFSALTPAVLSDLLRHHMLVASERRIFDAVLRWLHYGEQDSGAVCRPAAEQEVVLPLIRFPLMDVTDLQEIAQDPFTANCPKLLEYVSEALLAQTGDVNIMRASSLDSALFSVEGKRLVAVRQQESAVSVVRYQRRASPACQELMYVFDGDTNGVLRYIATSYATREWVNPVLTKRVEVRASSPASRYTDAKVLVSGQFARTSYAGPRYENGAKCTWWMVDLGPQHRLLCNYYTMRQDGSSDFARHWALQGSADGIHWVDLRRHVADNTVRMPGQYASWAVLGPAASVPHRAFRVLLTGPTTSTTNPWNFCLAYIELYGYFFREEEPQQAEPQPAGACAAAT